MSIRNAKFMALYPHKGNFRAPNIANPFYFHIPAPYSVNTGDALTADNNVVEAGQVTSPQGTSLKTVTWSSLFIVEDYMLIHGARGSAYGDYPAFVKSPPSGFGFDDAFESIKMLEDMKKNGDVALLVIRDQALGKKDDVNMPVILTSFSWHEEAGEPDCRYYDIAFKEYKPLIIRQVPRTGADAPGTAPRPDKYGRFLPAHYTLPKQMGIGALCKAAYHKNGTTLRARIIKANGGKKWLHKIHATYHPKQSGGPWFLPKHTKVYIPPVKGPLHPKGDTGAANRMSADEE